jgi:hypothetical protein
MVQRTMRGLSIVIGVSLPALVATGSAAQQEQAKHAAPPRAGIPSQLPLSASPHQPPPNQSLPVSIEQALYLIRSTLLTLNDANRSGNYTVLRDLAAFGFQAKNTAADLALSFTDLRRRNFDLFAVALTAPHLTTPPTLDGEGRLRLTGVFPTTPLQIAFDLLFENAGGQWRLFGISVATPVAPGWPTTPLQQAPAAPKSK